MSAPDIWAELAPIGRDPRTGGYDRCSFTAVDAELRAWFVREAQARGLDVRPDRNGGLWAWWGEPGPGAVVTGSHLDSVPGGGAYDGPLGVVSALLAVDDLRERGVVPARPLAVVVLAEEEGARFGVACLGSRLMTGALDADRPLVDADGVTLRSLLPDAGPDPALLAQVGVFVELHVEQGRALADLGAPVGVASAVWPHGRWRLAFTGASDHAGTTRLVDRHDPVLPFATTALTAREAAAEAGALATFARIHVEPGAANAVASSVVALLDARADDEAVLTALVARVTGAARRAAAEHGVGFEVTAESVSPAVVFPHALRDRLAAVLDGAPVLATGAGHDAGVLAACVPAAMLFVRNPTGTSHSPAEHAADEDCVAGVHALSAVLEELLA